MPPINDRLRAIKTFTDLIRYLEEELDWPLQEYGFDDLTFEYSAIELGLKEEDAAKVKTIHQLRPFQHNQPWGIFFVEFENKRMPVVVLRRILSNLVLKKRASANKAQVAAWNLDDLLFIAAFGDEGTDQREIAFAHFHQETGDLPTLKVMGWDGADTALKLDYVAATLRERLCWPSDTGDADAWREQWSHAFRHRLGHVIRTADALADRLAGLARSIRDAARTLMKHESENGPLRRLHKAFQTALIHDLSEADFADTYAQTITYGLLTAAISRTEMSEGRYGTALIAENVTDMVPITNPFLREMLETFLKAGGRQGGIDFDELGIQDVVELLRGNETDLPEILRDFGNRTKGEDPVIHFYEHFLSAYNRQLKIQRGVFYTPQPVVSFIVRSVHELLQTEFGLEDGLASTITWGEMTKSHAGLKIPDGVSPESPFVQILDIATGTATFLVEVIDVIHRTLRKKWTTQRLSEAQQKDAWNDYVPKYLLPRLHGYELMMAPYAIAHMKVGLKLYETGYRFERDERVRIYLTNALKPATSDGKQLVFVDWAPALAHEAQAVNTIKRYQRFTVVLGNPPYSGISVNRNEWIEGLLKGEIDTSCKKANYYEIDGESLGEKKLWLQDDYVKFIRLSHFFLEQSSIGVHGMITNHSFVDSPTCRGMRYQMLSFYSTLNIIDLHGSTKKGEMPPEGVIDENVFDILPGVAISICARMVNPKTKLVQTFDLWGTRSLKSEWLQHNGLGNDEWTVISPSNPYYLFVKRHLDFEEEYYRYPSLRDIFPFYGTGIQTSRDDFATDYDLHELEKRLKLFFDLHFSDKEIADAFNLSDTRGWKIKDVRRLSSLAKVCQDITQCIFRPFDTKWIALTKDVVDWPRLEVMACVGPGKMGLLCSRQQAVPGFRHAIVINRPVDMFCISNKSREGQTLFPLYVHKRESIFDSSNNSRWRLNIGKKYLKYAISLLGFSMEPEDGSNLMLSIGEKTFFYFYAILYSPLYRARYEDLLKMDYPRLPFSRSLDLFNNLAKLGNDLVTTHLMESSKLDQHLTTYIGPVNPEVIKISYAQNTVWIDKAQTRGFCGVPEDVWNFHIGGYQVCEKWLKDRKGRQLSEEDIAHYQKIVVALKETIRIMGEIDEVIEDHGGWPYAFS